jgi:hypothetical protein
MPHFLIIGNKFLVLFDIIRVFPILVNKRYIRFEIDLFEVFMISMYRPNLFTVSLSVKICKLPLKKITYLIDEMVR